MSTRVIMDVMGRLLVAADLMQRVYGRRLVQHVLSMAVVSIVALMVFAIVLGGSLLACLYVSYAALMGAGFTVQAALGITAGIAILMMLLLMGIAYAGVHRANHLVRKRRSHLPSVSEVTATVTDTFDAFVSGLSAPGNDVRPEGWRRGVK